MADLLLVPVDMSESWSAKSLILGPWTLNLLCLSAFRFFGVSYPQVGGAREILVILVVLLNNSSSKLYLGISTSALWDTLEIALERGLIGTLVFFFDFSA